MKNKQTQFVNQLKGSASDVTDQIFQYFSELSMKKQDYLDEEKYEFCSSMEEEIFYIATLVSMKFFRDDKLSKPSYIMGIWKIVNSMFVH